MRKSILIIPALLLALTACTKQNDTEEDGNQIQFETTLDNAEAEIAAFKADDGTKTLIAEDLKVYWVNGDKVGFWPAVSDVQVGDPKQFIFYMSMSEPSNFAWFQANGWAFLRNNPYYSYCPYDANAAYNNVTADYTGQNQTENGSMAHLGAKDYLHSYVSSVTGNNQRLRYDHIGSLVKMVFTVPQIYQGHAFKTLTLSANSDIFVQSAKFNPSLSSLPVLTDQELSNSITISLNGDSGFACDGDRQITVYAMMAPSNWSSTTVTATLSNGSNNIAGNFTGGNMTAGHYYVYTAQLKDAVTDLSLNGTANCYMVSESGEYKFKLVKGNTSTAVAAQSARILWSTFNTNIKPDENDLIQSNSVAIEGSDGNKYIKFHVNADCNTTKGNAVIAAYAGANCTGDILWSWHIWLTDLPEDQEYPNNAGFLMDRNLGALTKTGATSFGFFYQWGRKDPFIGFWGMSIFPPNRDNISWRPYRFKYWGDVSFDPESYGSLELSIKNPTTFYKKSYGNDWDQAIEGKTSDYWTNGPAKGKYDPCPPGYKVLDGITTAEAGHYDGFWEKALQTKSRVVADGYWSPATFSNTQLGSIQYVTAEGLQFNDVNRNRVYIPSAGYIEEDGTVIQGADDINHESTHDGYHVLLWSSSSVGYNGTTLTNNSGSFDVNMKEGTSYGGGVIQPNWNSARAAGKNVRCMKMITTTRSPNANEGFGSSSASTW